MKQFENKTTEIAKDANENCKYSDLIELQLKKVPQGGLSYDDIKNRLKIGEVLSTANGEIELEDGYFQYLKKLINDARWGVVHKDLIQLKDDINEVK
jgi:hypothetical protein